MAMPGERFRWHMSGVEEQAETSADDLRTWSLNMALPSNYGTLNPFTPDRPVAPDLFSGREREIRQVATALRSALDGHRMAR